ncbi:hypothetical protein [uncultured Aquitalea sp.]|uniref:hypothetical protein n=1 Tax=uncultured Aquitalea sp. TaxID=540272 RepID=UPI0025D93B72|nr:hypothetical protein [uncultured Aquitalea sp.]
MQRPDADFIIRRRFQFGKAFCAVHDKFEACAQQPLTGGCQLAEKPTGRGLSDLLTLQVKVFSPAFHAPKSGITP